MMTGFNWVDLIILFVFIMSILTGFLRGLFRELISLLVLVVAFIVATLFAHPVAAHFTNSPVVQNAVNNSSTVMGTDTTTTVSYVALAISFALLFTVTAIIGAIIGYFLNIAFQIGLLSIGNRLLGALFGLVRGYIITLVLIFLVQLTPFNEETVWQESRFVSAYQPAVRKLDHIVAPSIEQLKIKLNQSLHNLNENVTSTTTHVFMNIWH